MNSSTWEELVESVLRATLAGTADWQSSGAGRSHVLGTGSGSLVFSGPSPTSVVGEITIELLDENGDELAELRSSPFSATIAATEPFRAFGADVHTSYASPRIAAMMQQILEHLRSRQQRAEQVAREIISGLD